MTTRKGSARDLEALTAEITQLRLDLCGRVDQMHEEIRGLREAVKERDEKINRMERRIIALEEFSNSEEIATQDQEAEERKADMVIWKTKKTMEKNPSPKEVIKAISTSSQVDLVEEDIQDVRDYRGVSGKGPLIIKFKSIVKKVELLKDRSKDHVFRNSLSKNMQKLKQKAFIMKQRQRIFNFWEFKGLLYYQVAEGGNRERATNLKFMKMEFKDSSALPLFDLRR